ncbi:hypothetical protein K0G60_13185 [Bacteroides fragilis]|jgi:hypothetical protein|nr:hypothetical protein [Bacteroides fragilis]
MIYTDLDRISLRIFIDVFCGNSDAVCEGDYSEDEKQKAASGLVNEYMSIVGKKGILAEVSKKNEIISLVIKIQLMNCCRYLTEEKEWSTVCLILNDIGYSLDPNDHNKICSRIEAILSNSRFRVDKIMSEQSDLPKSAIMDRDYFVRERVAVMQHFNMHIDPDSFSAKEYAYMVKRMCDDVDLRLKSLKRK